MDASLNAKIRNSQAEADKVAVGQALLELQAKTCLKFAEVRAKPAGSHLYYTKIASPTLSVQ